MSDAVVRVMCCACDGFVCVKEEIVFTASSALERNDATINDGQIAAMCAVAY